MAGVVVITVCKVLPLLLLLLLVILLFMLPLLMGRALAMLFLRLVLPSQRRRGRPETAQRLILVLHRRW